MNVEFHYDFGSPNAYHSHQVIKGIEARTGITFNYVPILLGGVHKLTNNQSPMAAFGAVKGKLDYQRRETQRFMKWNGVDKFIFNSNFPVMTIAIMRGAVYARDKPWYRDYIDAMFHHMWEADKKMDDPEVIGAALAESGLPAEEIFAAVQTPEVKKALIDSTDASVARGNFGSPCFYVEDEMYYGKETLWQVEEEINRLKG